MRFFTQLVSAASIYFIAHTLSLAQEPASVGELLRKGAIKLGKTDVEQLVSGATVTGLQFSNKQPYKMTHKQGGTAEGHGSTPAAYVGGTWYVNDQGQLCVNVRNNIGSRFGSCTNYYKLNDTYFASLGDENSSPVLERKVER